MNDFTKIELEKLLIAVTETKFVECWSIHDKIQSMIDNYCEHQYAPHNEGGHYVVRCVKCGALPRTTI